MAEGDRSSGLLGGLVALFQQWQVVVAAIAAATAVWFGLEEQRRKQLEINRQAVVAAKAVADFSDPHNTLVEFRATYPEHAFCAALGYFVAEAQRRNAPGAAQAAAGATRTGLPSDLSEAVSTQIERLAGQGGLAFDDLQAHALAAAGDGETTSDCASLAAPFAWWAPAPMWTDCRLVVETYAQAQCESEAARRRAISIATVALGGPADAPGPDPDPGPVADGDPPGPPSAEDAGAPAAPADPADARAPAEIAADLGPGSACGPTPPTVFLQFTAEAGRAEAERVRAALVAAGWPAAGIDLVAGARTNGDVRYYWDGQQACAARLAAALGRLTGQGDFTQISLIGRYRNLPRGQLEAWLPPCNPAIQNCERLRVD